MITNHTSSTRIASGIFAAVWLGLLGAAFVLRLWVSAFNLDIFPPFTSFENREPTPPPTSATPIGEIGQQMESWYRDNFAYRTLLVQAYRSFVFGVLRSPVGREVVGLDGWIFRRGGDWAELDDYLGVFELTEQELSDWVTLFEGRTEWARAHGAVYLQLVSQVKAQSRTDMLPPLIKRHRGVNVSAQVRQALQGTAVQSNVLFMADVYDAARSRGERLFTDKDHHPDPYGTYLLFDVLNTALMDRFPELKPFPFYSRNNIPEDVRKKRAIGCYARDGRLKVVSPGEHQVDGVMPESSRRYPGCNVCTRRSDSGKEGLRVLMANDSYMRFILSSWKEPEGSVRFPFAQGIDEVQSYIWRRYTTSFLETAIEKYLPDVIIEQFPECRLNMRIIGLDETMRRAARFSRGEPIDRPSADIPTLVRVVFDDVKSASAKTVVAQLIVDGEVLDSVEMRPGLRRAVYFKPITISESAKLKISTKRGTSTKHTIALRH